MLLNIGAFLLCLHVALRDAFTGELVAGMSANITIILCLYVVKLVKGI